MKSNASQELRQHYFSLSHWNAVPAGEKLCSDTLAVRCFKRNKQAKKKLCGRLSTDRLQIINISASAQERELTATAFPARFSTLPALFVFSASFCHCRTLPCHLARTVPEPNCLQGVSTAEVLCAVSWRKALALGPSRCDMQQQAKRDWCFFVCLVCLRCYLLFCFPRCVLVVIFVCFPSHSVS